MTRTGPSRRSAGKIRDENSTGCGSTTLSGEGAPSEAKPGSSPCSDARWDPRGARGWRGLGLVLGATSAFLVCGGLRPDKAPGECLLEPR